MKMVVVDNPESETPPENARYLSDKNRRVEQETRARQTSLERAEPKPEPRTEPSPRPEPLPGAPKPRRPDAEREQKAERPRAPTPPGVLSMRSPAPQLAPRPETRPVPRAENGLQPAPRAELPRPPEPRPRFQLQLDHQAHDRIYGQKAVKERELARLSPSAPKGSFQKKWARVRSSLENFVPEVRTGNQTALGTRADPFAAYIHRMHLSIHRLWGWGFLVDIDNKPDANPLSDMSMWTLIEIVVSPDGEVDKATIVKPSGFLPFDVAALDTVFTGGPYPPTPRAIRSADGKVYMHWRFHRDHRQCGTFGVDPYILTTPPKGPIDADLSEVEGGAEEGARSLRRLNRPVGGSSGGQAGAEGRPVAASGERPAAAAPASASRDERRKSLERAAGAARAFLQGLHGSDARAMAAACGLPFSSGGRAVATTRGQLEALFRPLVEELGGREPGALQLMTAMEARSRLGAVPPGVEPGGSALVGRVDLGDATLTLVLEPAGDGFRVTGLSR